MGQERTNYEIREVWAENLEEEMDKIRDVLEDFPYVAMDTEFPGVVARPVGDFMHSGEYQFQTVRVNVDLLKIIQLGLTFANDQGEYPPGCCTWQFNFKFDLGSDMYAQDSIDLLTQSGIDFSRNNAHGIDVNDFGELMMSSGLVLNESLRWISFHSGYDFGYLLKVLTCQPLPRDEATFLDLMSTYFPCIYDVKELMRDCDFKGGLQRLAEELSVVRHGPQHQAGSDSLLTAQTFFRLRDLYFKDHIDEKFVGQLFGFSSPAVAAMSSL